jgi:hypothetical protein
MTDSASAPNWLVCSTCNAPIATADELICEEVEVLKNAVYAYKLDMLEREVSVYSATNSAENRFDVVRAVLSDTVSIPSTSRVLMDEREGLRLFLRHFHVISLSEREEEAVVNPERIAEDLDRLLENSQYTSENDEIGDYDAEDEGSSSDTPPKKQRMPSEIICERVETQYTEPTDDYSWFPSFSWTIASCVHCHEHLGWVFWERDESEKWQKRFLSLVVTRLREKFISSGS